MSHLQNRRPFYRLRINSREEAMIDYALAHRWALYFRGVASDSAKRGYNNETARQFSRKYAAAARKIWQTQLASEL